MVAKDKDLVFPIESLFIKGQLLLMKEKSLVIGKEIVLWVKERLMVSIRNTRESAV